MVYGILAYSYVAYYSLRFLTACFHLHAEFIAWLDASDCGSQRSPFLERVFPGDLEGAKSSEIAKNDSEGLIFAIIENLVSEGIPGGKGISQHYGCGGGLSL